MNSHPSATPLVNAKVTVLGTFCSLGAIALRLLINAFKIPNFNPVGGLGIVHGAKRPLWLACLWSLFAIVGSDFALYFLRGCPSDHFLMIQFVYPSMLLYVLLGRLLARNGPSWRLGVASLLGSAQFYLITNFGAWMLYTDRYHPDWSGLVHSYVAGIPFLGLTMAGDMAFTVMFAGLYGWLEQPAKETTAETVIA